MKIGEKNYLKIEVVFNGETIAVFTDKDLKISQGTSIDYTPALMPKYDQKEALSYAIRGIDDKLKTYASLGIDKYFEEFSKLVELRKTLKSELEELSDDGKT